jgi:hypothetical protein
MGLAPTQRQPGSADLEASLTQRQWDEMYQRLVEFNETHGHPHVTQGFTKLALGTWVHSHRTEESNGLLDPRRVEKVKAIGLAWNRKDEQKGNKRKRQDSKIATTTDSRTTKKKKKKRL